MARRAALLLLPLVLLLLARDAVGAAGAAGGGGRAAEADEGGPRAGHRDVHVDAEQVEDFARRQRVTRTTRRLPGETRAFEERGISGGAFVVLSDAGGGDALEEELGGLLGRVKEVFAEECAAGRLMVGAVALQQNKEFVTRQRVVAFPTARFFRPDGDEEADGLSFSSLGGRLTSASVIEFLNDQLGTRHVEKRLRDPVTRLDANSFDAVTMDPNRHAMVTLLCRLAKQDQSWDALDATSRVAELVARQRAPVVVGVSQDAQICDRYNLQDGVAVVLYFGRESNAKSEAVLVTERSAAGSSVQFEQDMLDELNDKMDLGLAAKKGDGVGVAREDISAVASILRQAGTGAAEITASFAEDLHAQICSSTTAVELQREAKTVLQHLVASTPSSASSYLSTELSRLERLLSNNAASLTAASQDAFRLRRDLVADLLSHPPPPTS